MAEPFIDAIIHGIEAAEELYHRLILVIAPSGSGKTAALRKIQQQTGAPLVNINLELSKRMLDLTERQRSLQLPRILEGILCEAGKGSTPRDPSKQGDLALLDNIEVLFDLSLRQDPLRLLQGDG